MESKEKTNGGIIIPESAKEKQEEAEIIAVGKGKLLDSGERLSMDVKVGDKVLLNKYSGMPSMPGMM